MKFKFVFILIWVVFTLSLATWWMIFGLQQNDQLQSMISSHTNQKILRQHTMLLWEGGILLLSLLGGGGALLYYAIKEKRQSDRLKEFFATFSHEIKTSLTSLRLQAEALQEDFSESQSPLLPRLVSDTVRLEIQLENSLFYSSGEKRNFFLEERSVKELVEPLKANWPGLQIDLINDALVVVDTRAMESVFKNLFYNSLIHGRSTKIDINVTVSDAESSATNAKECVRISIQDDGSGFIGDLTTAGLLFQRQSTTSGSGLGLYLVRTLISEMNGCVQFSNSEKGFRVDIDLPGRER